MHQSPRKQAVIYCRVSSIKQTKDGDGLRSQETRCRDFAARKGYTVTDVFQDDVSGSLVERPGMKAMLASIRKRRAQGVVVIIDDVSRLARGLQAHLELRGAIAGAGGVLESPSIEFGEDPDSLLVENLLASVSLHQRQKNGEQTMNRMRSRVLNGYWVFQAPVGYKYHRVPGRGMILRREEPAASVVTEALEGYASGRFETQADVGRFLQTHPLFPRGASGRVANQRVSILIRNCVYAGFVEAPSWDVPMRKGQHDALIAADTWQRIQQRLAGVDAPPRRANLNEDFPLRGFVLCGCCSTPLTACWSKGSHSRHAYYLCPKRGCDSYGKSIRREAIEAEFAELLHTVQPTEGLFKVARAMFEDLWNRRLAQAEGQAKAFAGQLGKIEKQVAQLLERILDASVPSVIGAYEDRIRKLEEEKLILRERMAQTGRPVSSFDATLRTALGFLASPWNLWSSGRLEDRRAVLKLTFASKLHYRRGQGFRTTELSLPFKLLSGSGGSGMEMVRPEGFEPPTCGLEGRRSIQLS